MTKKVSKIQYNGAALFSEFVLNKVNELVQNVNDTREIVMTLSRQPKMKGFSELSKKVRDLESEFESVKKKFSKDVKKVNEIAKELKSEESTPTLYQERYDEGYRRGYEDAREDVKAELIEKLNGTKD